MVDELELISDLNELNRLSSQTSRPNVKNFLDSEIRRIEIIAQKAKAKTVEKPASSNGKLKAIKKITAFAFDESDKFAKIYLTIADAHKLSADAIKTSFTESSVAVSAELGTDTVVEFTAVGFSFPIDVSKSHVKVKTDSLLVMLKKIKEGQKWGKLLKLDKKVELELPKVDDSSNPQDGLMSMMKKMYDDGDDDMKRTIKKAFYESRNKADGPNPMDF